MSKEEKNTGLMSSAGLVRYFEADEGIMINPVSMITFCILMGLFVIVLNVAI